MGMLQGSAEVALCRLAGRLSAWRRLASTDAKERQQWEVTQQDGVAQTRVSVSGSGSWQLTREGRPGSGGGASPGRLGASLAAQAAATFLPAGYPATVAPGYLRYACWQALHHCAGAANGVLASTFLLYSVGLGAGAVPIAGALSWVLKDGLGQAGTLLFGRALAHNFDVQPRLWYLLASAKLNAAIALEISTILAPAYFLPIGSLANAAKGLAWMAGGSSRSAFNVAFAEDNNIADVTAKATSQTICTSLLGTAAGIAVASSIGQSPGLAFASYAAIASVHLYSGLRSVRCVPLATLNPARLQLLVAGYLEQQAQQEAEQGQQQQQGPREGQELEPCELPRPPEMASLEPILMTHASGAWVGPLDVGPPLRRLSPGQREALPRLLPAFAGERHVLLPCASGGGGSAVGDTSTAVLLHEQAGAEDCILAFLHSALLRQRLREGRQQLSSGPGLEACVRASLRAARRRLPALLCALRGAGWDTERVVLESRRRRLTWGQRPQAGRGSAPDAVTPAR